MCAKYVPQWQRLQYQVLWDLVALYHQRRNTWTTAFLTINGLLLGGIALVFRLEPGNGAGALTSTDILLCVCSAGIVINAIWYFLNRRLDFDDALRFKQLNVLEKECQWSTDGVWISTDGCLVNRASEKEVTEADLREPRKGYIGDLRKKQKVDEYVPVRQCLWCLAALFAFFYILVAIRVAEYPLRRWALSIGQIALWHRLLSWFGVIWLQPVIVLILLVGLAVLIFKAKWKWKGKPVVAALYLLLAAWAFAGCTGCLPLVALCFVLIIWLFAKARHRIGSCKVEVQPRGKPESSSSEADQGGQRS